MTIFSAINKVSVRLLLWLCVLFSSFMLGSALIGQYGFELYPCDLCIYQRIPYAIIIVVGIIGGLLIKSAKKLYIITVFLTVLLLVDAGIAAYHSGVEYDIFKGPSACSSGGGSGQTLEEIRAAIMNAPLVSCKQAMAYIFGLSMAMWNMIAASLVFICMSIILIKNRKKYYNGK